MNIQIVIAFGAYFLILLCIGFLSYRKQMTDSDFIVGNRSLNFWVIALSAHASDMSSWLFMAFPAAIMLRGTSQLWIGVGLLLGMFLNWQFVATRLRQATEKLESYTLSTFFERHFQDKSGSIRLLTACMLILFLAWYLSAGLIAMGMLFETVFGINYYVGLSIASCVVVIYTFFGGFITVAWTDLFQAVFLMLMVLLVPAVAYFHLEHGVQSIQEAAATENISFNLLTDYSLESLLTILFLVLGWGLGYFGQPHIVTKFLGIKTPSELHKSKYLGMSWMLLALAGASLVGYVGMAFFQPALNNPELVFVKMVQEIFPPLAAGFILCGVLAASMSTMDSQILVAASVISEDIYKFLFRKEASPALLLKASRVGVILIAGVSLLIAFNHNDSVLDTVQYAWSGLGCAFGPLVLAALYSKQANRYGAIAGIIVGGLLAGTWHLINPYVTDYAIPAMIPGFFLSLASIFLVSWVTRKRTKRT